MILLNNLTILFGCLTGKPIIAAIGHNYYNASDESCRLSAAKSAATLCDLSARMVRDGKTRKTRKSTQVERPHSPRELVRRETTHHAFLWRRPYCASWLAGCEICVLCCSCLLFPFLFAVFMVYVLLVLWVEFSVKNFHVDSGQCYKTT